MGDTSEDKPSFSILEKFRQLAKEKEQERSETKKSKPNETIDAVYFRNANTSNDRRRGNFSRRGNFRGKRKFDGDHSSLPDWKVRRMQERHKIGPHVGPKEQNVGITEYISSLPGFNGIIKQRFTDFQLNEISEDGTICKLTSQDIPQNPAETPDDSAIDDAELLKILPKEKWDKLYSIVANEDPEESVDIDVTNISKDDRVTIHNAIKSLYKDKVISNTIDKNEKKILKITYSTDQQERRAKRRSMWKNRGFLYFLLHKENMDTMEAVNLLAHKLLKKGNQIMFCGTKDKRAVSTQLMCVKKVAAERLHKIQPLRNVVLGNYEYKSTQLKLGQLKGNRFRIAVRNVDATDEAISETIESLKTRGFLNYYGMQRFGSSLIVPTHVIGLALIRRDWKEAVDLILKPRTGERCFAETAEARTVWSETRDAKKALKCFHWKNTSIEAKLLQGLDKNGPTAYLNALENLTRNLTMFYCHAYQSLIWNKVISRRVKEFGLTVLPGDIILLDNNVEAEEEEEELHKKDNVKNGNENEDSDLDETDNKEDDSQIRDEFVNEKPKAFINVKILNEEEAKEASIEDIVYPLPGYDISYPNNVTAGWYKEFLAEDNLSDASLLECRPYAHIYPMYGTYRKMLHKPKNVSWSVIKYSEENCDLLLTDLDIMNEVAPPKDCPDGKYKALLLQFDLGACTYATMALREIMKCETSSGYQATLSAQHQPENVPDAEPQVNTVEVVNSESVPNNCTEVNEEKSNVL